MLRPTIYALVFLGSVLMIFNIYGFVQFALYVKGLESQKSKNSILYIPIVLLVLFLLGYLAVGILGKPDLIVAGILFGGSIFVYIMYKLLYSITRQIVVSEQMASRLKAAEESSRAKSSFLASISHEMRTPMNVILGLDSMALKNRDLPPQTRGQLEAIGQSGRHLLGLINNILDMNSLEADALEIKNEAFSLSDALDQVSAITRTLCEEKGLEYRASVSEAARGRCMGDAMQLKKTLLSILDNAVKYTDAPGSVSLSVDCISEADLLRTLRFTVADTGVGIDPDFLPRLFDVFSREDTSSTSRFGGSGLSLAVNKRTVELMGGTITVESEKNVGSAFTVTLPLRFVSLPEAPPEEPTAPEASASLAGRRVLIVEDIPENAEIVADLLELEDVETDHAENGQIALDMLGETPPWHYDAILMDLRMPVMDGLEATRQIRAMDREDAKGIPIIALTANAFESDVKQSMEAGMNAHLAKPADADELYNTLRTMIEKAPGPERRAAL